MKSLFRENLTLGFGMIFGAVIGFLVGAHHEFYGRIPEWIQAISTIAAVFMAYFGVRYAWTANQRQIRATAAMREVDTLERTNPALMMLFLFFKSQMSGINPDTTLADYESRLRDEGFQWDSTFDLGEKTAVRFKNAPEEWREVIRLISVQLHNSIRTLDQLRLSGRANTLKAAQDAFAKHLADYNAIIPKLQAEIDAKVELLKRLRAEYDSYLSSESG
jgi:hypothetical protein